MGERDDLVRIICHELRGAITPLGSWARLLRRGGVTADEAAHAGEVIDRSLQVLSRLAGDLASLIEPGPRALLVTRRPLDLCDVVLATVGLVTQEAALKEVALHVDVPAEPVVVLGDPVRLIQMIGNLVRNAVKFTDSGGKVVVEVIPDRDRAQVVVKDSGVGIGLEFLPHVFDKFAREAPDDAAHNGSGLGLHVVKHLVDLHQGHIQAYSAGPGRGSRFVVTLPLVHPVAA